MRHLGILAHSVEGATLCLRTFCADGFRRLGPHLHPDVNLDCIAMGHSMPAWDAGDLPPITSVLATSVRRLHAAGGRLLGHAFRRVGIDSMVPELHERVLVNDIIFGELVEGVFTEESRRAYVDVIGGLQRRGCDAVALVCTEIPLLVDDGVSPLPTLDSTRLLAHAAFDVAVGERPLPGWRGGPR